MFYIVKDVCITMCCFVLHVIILYHKCSVSHAEKGVCGISIILHGLGVCAHLHVLECACDVGNCFHGNNWLRASIALWRSRL